MLINLVRESVLQCFCTTCHRLPAMQAGPTSKQPNKLRFNQPRVSKKNLNFISTEIRCQEKSKGGLKYEVIMAEPNLVKSQAPIKKESHPKQLSAQEIEEKLKAAEQRRLDNEAQKVLNWNAKLIKIEEASRKKDEINQEFISSAKETLTTKMEHSEVKRDAIISDMREKIRCHTNEIKRNKSLMDQQRAVELDAFNEKLNYASNLRNENIKRILERLRKHNSLKKSEVRQTIESPDVREEKARIIENRLFIAEKNRLKEIEKKLDLIRKHEIRAMMVRQNKALLASRDAEDINTPVEA